MEIDRALDSIWYIPAAKAKYNENDYTGLTKEFVNFLVGSGHAQADGWEMGDVLAQWSIKKNLNADTENRIYDELNGPMGERPR